MTNRIQKDFLLEFHFPSLQFALLIDSKGISELVFFLLVILIINHSWCDPIRINLNI